MATELAIIPKKFIPSESITESSANAWKNMGISKDWQIKRLTDLAAMFERRLADIDPQYPTFPYWLSNYGEIK